MRSCNGGSRGCRGDEAFSPYLALNAGFLGLMVWCGIIWAKTRRRDVGLLAFSGVGVVVI